MKFSSLTSNSRSILAALAASSTLNTYRLGLCCTPKLDAPAAANVLCDMRKKGLIFSQQKPMNQSYAEWGISEFGYAVFAGRPDQDVQPTNVEPQRDVSAQPARFVVGATGVTSAPYGDQESAVAAAQAEATRSPGTEYRVYKLVAVASMPVPQAQITLL